MFQLLIIWVLFICQEIVDPVAQEIERQGLEGVPRNLGTQFAGQYCDDLLRNVKGGTGKPVCGTYLINGIINSLPIYFIIAHSSVDVDSDANNNVAVPADWS